MKNSVEAKGISESISLVEMLEMLVAGVASKTPPTSAVPWAGIGITLEQIRSKLTTVQNELNAPAASSPQDAPLAVQTAPATPAVPPRRSGREIEMLDEATFNARPVASRGPLGTLSGRVQVAPTVATPNGQSGKTRELGVKPTQSSGTPAAEALSNEEAVVAE